MSPPVHQEAQLRAWAIAAAVGIAVLDGGAAAADPRLDHLLTIARAHGPSWAPHEDAGAIVLSTTISGWEPSQHCLKEVEGSALTTLERELAAVLGELRARAEVTIQIEGVSDATDFQRHRTPRSDCAELTFSTRWLAAIQSHHSRLGVLRGLSVWTVVARAWFAAYGSMPRSVVLDLEPRPDASADVLIVARRESTAAATARKATVVIRVRSTAEPPEPAELEPAVSVVTPAQPPPEPIVAELIPTHDLPPDAPARPRRAPPQSRTAMHSRALFLRILGADHVGADLGIERTLMRDAPVAGWRLVAGLRLGAFWADRDYRVSDGMSAPILLRAQLPLGLARRIGAFEAAARVAPGALLPDNGALLDAEVSAGWDIATGLWLVGTAAASQAKTAQSWKPLGWSFGVGLTWSLR